MSRVCRSSLRVTVVSWRRIRWMSCCCIWVDMMDMIVDLSTLHSVAEGLDTTTEAVRGSSKSRARSPK